MKKYIRFSDGSFKIFSPDLMHCNQTDGKTPISAGFIVSIGGSLHCTGESASLGLSAQKEDSNLANEWLRDLR